MVARGAESTQAIARDPFGGESRKSRLQLRVNKRALSSSQSVLPVLHSGLRPRFIRAGRTVYRLALFELRELCSVLSSSRSSVVFSLAILSALASYSSISSRGRKVLGSNSRSDHRHGALTLGVSPAVSPSHGRAFSAGPYKYRYCCVFGFTEQYVSGSLRSSVPNAASSSSSRREL